MHSIRHSIVLYKYSEPSHSNSTSKYSRHAPTAIAMVTFSRIFGAAILAPFTQDRTVLPLELNSLEIGASAKTVYHCNNVAIGEFDITRTNAVNAMNKAPADTGLSGYPHHFQNLGPKKITWDTDTCNRAKTLWEFPVLINGRLYKANKHHPKDDPGPARVIYTFDGQPAGHRLFFGVIAHEGEGNYPNRGDLAKCTK